MKLPLHINRLLPQSRIIMSEYFGQPIAYLSTHKKLTTYTQGIKIRLFKATYNYFYVQNLWINSITTH